MRQFGQKAGSVRLGVRGCFDGPADLRRHDFAPRGQLIVCADFDGEENAALLGARHHVA